MAAFKPLQIDLVRNQTNVFVQRPKASDMSNTIVAGQLVVLSSSGSPAQPTLTACAAGAVSFYGQCIDASKLSTDRPPNILPFPVGEGEYHNVFDPTGGEFEITVGNNTQDFTSTRALASTAVIGSSFGLGLGTSTYAGIHYLNTSNTTNLLFTVVGWADGVVAADTDPRVRVRPIASTIQ